MKALVAGGAGFIGSHLVERLVADGHHVSVIDNLSSGRIANLQSVSDDVLFIAGDVRDKEAVRRAVVGADIVFHKAALVSVPASIEDPIAYMEVNALGTVNVLQASAEAGVERLLFASSSSVYGHSPKGKIQETSTPDPQSPYALSKLAGEEAAALYTKIYGLEVLAFRYFNVYGPRQDAQAPYAAVIPKFVEAVASQRRPIIFGDGNQTREFVHVSDVVRANLLAATAREFSPGVMNISSGKAISVRQVLDTVVDIASSSVEPIYREPRAGDVRHSSADISKARDSLGFLPRVSIEAGIQSIFEASLKVARFGG